MRIKNRVWLFLIIVLAGLLRFANFESRWVFNQDQARDATIGLYAIRNGVRPEVGSPSSAGPFNFGPWYQYLIMFWERAIPVLNGPWIGFAILSTVSVVLYAKIGEAIYQKKGLIIFGLLAAVAYGQVENAPDMLNTVIVGFGGALMSYFGVKYIKSENLFWAVLTGWAVGISINFHFQALGTLSWLLAIFLINKLKIWERIKLGGSMFLGLVLAFLPLIVFDIKRNGVWIKSVIEYYTVGVNKFYAPVRWLTEIKDFWPQLFGNVIFGWGWGGYVIIGLALILAIIFSYELRVTSKFKIDKSWLVVGMSLLIQVFLMRSYKGVRSREYMIAFHGLIILITSWVIVEYYKLNKYVGGILLAIILVMTGFNNWKNITHNKSQAREMIEIKKELDKRYLGKVSLFQYKQSDMVAMPVFYEYYFENRIGVGKEISLCDGNRYVCPEGEIISKNKYRIYEGSSKWDKITSKNIYERLMVNYGI